MADQPNGTAVAPSPATKPERPSVLDMLRERQQSPENKERELKAAEEFDHDFHELQKIVDQFHHMGGVVITDDGMELDVDGILVQKVIIRKIEQIMRFDAAEGYPLEPRYEIVIQYRSERGDMADTLVVNFEELFKKPLNETIEVIKERVLEAKRSSGNELANHRVWAIHDEVHKKGGEVDHEVYSDGKDVVKKRDYDARVRVEIEKAIDAIRSAVALKDAAKRIHEV
jgi:hypothetical protein